MDKYVYANNKMKELMKLVRKREKIQERLKENNITTKRRSSLLADLNFISMHIGRNRSQSVAIVRNRPQSGIIVRRIGLFTLKDIREDHPLDR